MARPTCMKRAPYAPTIVAVRQCRTAPPATRASTVRCSPAAASNVSPASRSRRPIRVFVDNGDGTVTDRTTCLVWEKKTGNYDGGRECGGLESCDDLHNVNNRYSWSNSGLEYDGGVKRLFLDELNGMGERRAGCFADHCDWRLPSELGRSPAPDGSTELQDILGPLPCAGSPCIDPIFGPTAPSTYWSSTTNPNFPQGAWEADFELGFLDGTIKTSRQHVRAVRGGATPCAARSHGATCDSGVDGTVRT
jgi:hypothetical protein